MNPSSSSSSSNLQSMAASTSGAASEGGGGGGGSYGKKVRKPYTITKSRESWTDEEHDKFLEALQLFDRDWKKIEDYVGSKTVIQIRSHAQKYFLKVQKNGTTAHVPPPRPKRKATHPYPHKATKNASMNYPSTLSCVAPGHFPWNEKSLLMITAPNGNAHSQDEYAFLHSVEEADMGSEGIAGIINGSFSSNENSLPSLDMPNQGSLVHGTPDFAEVYNFIGSVFDPNTNGHLEKMKEMDPINYETVLLLMRNLTANLSSHNFEPIRHVLSSFDDQYTEVGGTGDITVKQDGDCQPAERPTTYSWACLDASSSFSHLVLFNDEQACKEWNFKLRMQY